MKPQTLQEHPEGGRFQEVFRSKTRITTFNGNDKSALTHIYFSLNKGETSKWHKVNSDEIWNLYKGEMMLYIWDGTTNKPEQIKLSADDNEFCHVVPAGYWQAAEPISDSILVGCSVAPGFDFQDFKLMDVDSIDATTIIARYQEMKKFV